MIKNLFKRAADKWRGQENKPVFYVWHLFGRKSNLQETNRGWSIDLHKMVDADDPECFHTHRSNAYRLILWGGYVEQLPDGSKKRWYPGMFGRVDYTYTHRISRLLNGKSSWSLWFSGPRIYEVKLVGSGWTNNTSKS